ncbi:hypothetical protein ROHU_026760 [Labeo rohita]|uniref:BEN domain-containing protein n=1 Tax=Labeo rohita TaxID=84645 RepID=A0A498LW41_LABRO|nr:hypothetical protein ROHU_010654 [Labeo rohita]RXN17692.1 hypothetical protein ROHU_026760 [Labeo rohita]
MSFPSYALFYFPDSDIVKVDSTDIILREHRRAEYQVSSREQLRSEDGYIEVRLTSRGRHGQTKILAAKILLLGDIYKDLIMKRDAFKRGEDIWKTTAEKGKKTPEAIKSASTSQSAADAAMGDKLKRDLQNLQRKKSPVTSTPVSDDSDNTDIDLFENTEQRQSRKRAALESDNEQEDNASKEFENSLLQRTSPQNSPVTLDDDVVKALKELPGIVSSLKDVLESMKRGPYGSRSSSSELSLAESSKMISLADSDVTVSKRMYDRLNKSRVSLFTQELASLIFGKEKLARCTLTGKLGLQTSKDQLDPHKVTVLIDTVIKEFPRPTVSEVRALIRRKCNNESTSKNSHSPLEG